MKSTYEEVAKEYEDCREGLDWLVTILGKDKDDFMEMYHTVQPGHYYQWGAYKALDLIGGKWKHPILMQLFINGNMRYSQLKRALADDGITDNTLSVSLKELARDGLITKEVYPEVPVRVEYATTEKAFELWKIMLSLSQWYNTYKLQDLKEELQRLEP